MRLRYVIDTIPGFTRTKGWFGVVYRDEKGRKIRNANVLARIRSLGIPPAYSSVWICPFANGHIQATAIDARNRKQYIYHHDWIAKQNEGKFHRMNEFAVSLSRIRRRVDHDLRLRGIPKDKVLAAIVELLDTAFIRIGNEEYAKDNHSFGLTTLRNRHVKGTGEYMGLAFDGKDGIAHEFPIEDERIRKIVATCHDIPGQKLFEYLDHEGKPHDVQSEDVNEYLKSISKEEITAKDFRTWHGTVIVASYLWDRPAVETKREIQQNVKAAIQRAADALGNTVVVCKKSYIHPKVLSLYAKGKLTWHAPNESLRKKYPLLHVHEVGLMKVLEGLN